MSLDYKIKPITTPVQHGEGPVWCSKTNTLFYVDTFNVTLYRLSPDEETAPESFKLDGHNSVGFSLPVEDKEDTFLVFADRMIYKLCWPRSHKQAATLERLATVEDDKPTNQFNDGKTDSKGRVWGGTLTRNKDLSVADKGGNLYIFHNSLNSIDEKITETSISNGMAWSKDNKYFYYIDSVTRYVVEYNFDEGSGRMYNRKIVFNLSNHPDIKGIPDGMTIDENDYLWIALFGGHQILQVNPKSGKILKKIKMPVTYITSLTFGGPDLNILYATTSRLKLKDSEIPEEPLAGSVFAITNLQVVGLPCNYVKL